MGEIQAAVAMRGPADRTELFRCRHGLQTVTVTESEMAGFRQWSASCWDGFMLARIGRLFVIKTRWEVIAVIYALALGSVDRGLHYVDSFPGVGGWLLFAACTGVVFMAGAKLFDAVRAETTDPIHTGGPAVMALPASTRVGGARPVVRRGSSFLLSRPQGSDRAEPEPRPDTAIG
jgi:hypothetical protein